MDTQTWMNVLWTTEDAVNLPPVQTHLAASTACVIRGTPATDLPAQVALTPVVH